MGAARGAGIRAPRGVASPGAVRYVHRLLQPGTDAIAVGLCLG